MSHKKRPSEIPILDGGQGPSVVEGPCLVAESSARPTSPPLESRRQRSARVAPAAQQAAGECDDPPAPPPRRNSRGSLTGGTTSIQARVMAAAAAVVPPVLGAGATQQREQLLPVAAGQGVEMKVDGHRAAVTLSKNGLSWSYESTRCCCIPSVHSESVPFTEMLSAEVLPPLAGMWRLPGTRLHRLVVWTFRRMAHSPAAWQPRQLTLECPSEATLQDWLQRINAAVAQQHRRPRRLLVFVNPFGGARRGKKIWDTVVRPVFDKAGIKCTAVETQHGGHARALLTSMPSDELAGYDGVVAIGGDGLFHEVINGLLELRSVPTGTTLDQQQWAALQQHLEQTAAADAAAAAAAGAADAQAGQAGGMQPPTGGQQQGGGPLVRGSSFGLPTVPQHQRRRGGPQRAGSIAASMRVGHIPAGSTDAVACTLNGTRSAFTAAMHIALGDACPLDVLRVDEADGRHAFATCMLSYGFMGDVMVESENYRWLGPLRYDVIGAKMLAANRSYHVRVSYLPAQSEQLEAAGKVCTAGCDLCRLGQEHVRLQRTFREVSSRSLAHRRSEWVHVEGDFAGIMLVIMPCRSEKSQQGVARYGHRSDGLIHLVMVKKCSRLQYLRFLLTLSHSGLAAGEHGFFTVVPAVAVHVEPVGAKQSRWNADGELLASNHITAEVHRGVIEVFARGVEV